MRRPMKKNQLRIRLQRTIQVFYKSNLIGMGRTSNKTQKNFDSLMNKYFGAQGKPVRQQSPIRTDNNVSAADLGLVRVEPKSVKLRNTMLSLGKNNDTTDNGSYSVPQSARSPITDRSKYDTGFKGVADTSVLTKKVATLEQLTYFHLLILQEGN